MRTLLPVIHTPSEFVSLREAMDRLFADSFVPQLFRNEHLTPMDVYETTDAYRIEAAIPGTKPEDITIETTEDRVRIAGKIENLTEKTEPEYLRRERVFGTFERWVTLPGDFESTKAEATYANGVLTLTLPKAEKSEPHRVKVTVKVPTQI